MVSPAKSEFSDDQDFSQSVSSEAMQKQLDWLLAKLMAAEAASTTIDEAGAVINGSSTLGVACGPSNADNTCCTQLALSVPQLTPKSCADQLKLFMQLHNQ